jgi:lactate dehydrogenase-like 2-hydroxyacid dehydrogenase
MPVNKRVVATRKFPDPVERRLALDYQAVLNPNDRIHDAESLLEIAAGADALFACATERFDAETLNRLDDTVRVIGTLSVGTDHIDLGAASDRGIVVTNTPDVLSEACADVAMMLLLAAARRAHEANRLVRSGAWQGWAPTQLLGRELNGRRLGILGMGRIGRALARRAKGFGLEVHYHNRTRLDPALENGAIYQPDGDTLARHSDFLSLSCPVTEATRGFLDAARIALLPSGAVVVNISRGDLIVDDALIAALRDGRVSGAGLDVFSGEPALDARYRDMDSVFLTPHYGSATHETRAAMGFMVLDSFDAFFAGEPVPHRVV